MYVKDENIIVDKSFAFAVRIVNLYNYLTTEKKEFVMSKQLLRSGTSIGANIREGVNGQTKPDFITKLSISLKEANETDYWIDLLAATNYLKEKEQISIKNDCIELIKLLITIIKSAKENL